MKTSLLEILYPMLGFKRGRSQRPQRHNVSTARLAALLMSTAVVTACCLDLHSMHGVWLCRVDLSSLNHLSKGIVPLSLTCRMCTNHGSPNRTCSCVLD